MPIPSGEPAASSHESSDSLAPGSAQAFADHSVVIGGSGNLTVSLIQNAGHGLVSVANE
jgi:hypothetical protein